MSKFLESSKKKIGFGKWSYRGLVVEKIDYYWIVKIISESPMIKKEQIKEINSLREVTAKNLCLKIDQILGPSAKKKRPPRIPPKKERVLVPLFEKEEMTVDDAKRIAYEFRWELEKHLPPESDKKIAVPVRRKETKTIYMIGWNGSLKNLMPIFDSWKEKNEEYFEISLYQREGSFDIYIKVKPKIKDNDENDFDNDEN